MRIPIRWMRKAPLLAVAVVGGLALMQSEVSHARAASVEPTPYEARYQVLRNGSVLGQSIVTLSRSGSMWRLRSQTQGTAGLAALARMEIEEDSRFRLRDGAPETIQYSYRQKAAWKNRQRSIAVDADAGTITSTDKDRTFPFTYRRNAVDRQLVSLAVALDVARGNKTGLSYRVVDRDEFEEERYRVGATGETPSALGKLRTVSVTRLRAAPGRTTQSWLAVDRGFVPVRILQREPDGETFELRILSLSR